MTKLRTSGLCSLAKMACIVIVFCAATISASRAQTFSTLVTFDGTDGDHPTTGQGPLVQGFDGNLYGSTFSGGTSGYYGLVFKMTPTGGLSTVYNFCSQTNCADGAEPGPPILATDGNLYGTTYGGGANNNTVCSGFPCGTVYKISSLGTPSTLYSFCAQLNCADGANPPTMLTQGTDGNFYGTTQDGGATGYGTFFRITPKGVLTTLHNFCAQPSCADGYSYVIQTIQATDGNFYGTAGSGPHGGGEVFRITPSGGFSIPYSFCAQTNCTDGSGPGVLVQATDGNIYGTAYGGGAHGGGTVFRLTLKGGLTTLYSFCSQTNCADGKSPGGLILAADGNFYGRTYGGGTFGYGTVFKIMLSGALTILYNCGQTNCPEGELVQATNGTLYGGTQFGGNTSACSPSGCGTLFSLSLGLPPFVETLPNSGKVGAKVTVLGTNLTGATSVSFNGAAATFTVVSRSEIKTTVPVGATTGKVQVKTPSRTFSSNVVFRVTP